MKQQHAVQLDGVVEPYGWCSNDEMKLFPMLYKEQEDLMQFRM